MSVTIHGHTTDGDPEGLRYLERLSSSEAQTFFDEARNKGNAYFKHDDKHYELVHTSAGTYAVTRVQSSYGIFG